MWEDTKTINTEGVITRDKAQWKNVIARTKTGKETINIRYSLYLIPHSRTPGEISP